MKKPFEKLTEPQRHFLQVLFDIDVNENIKLILRIRCKAILKIKRKNAKLRKQNHTALI